MSNAVHEALRAGFTRRMPSGVDVARVAVAECLGAHKNDPEWIKGHFSDLIEAVQAAAYREYLAAEQKVGGRLLTETLREAAGPGATADEVLDLIGSNFHALDRFFLGLTQGRRPRAGNAFEYLIRTLFAALEYPFTPRAQFTGSVPDFVLPSMEHFRKLPHDCVIFTAKRTLRERWRHILSEGAAGASGIFLATIDEAVHARDLDEMLRSRIYLVVPQRIKADCYGQASNAITFESFFRLYLDPAIDRWRQLKVS